MHIENDYIILNTSFLRSVINKENHNDRIILEKAEDGSIINAPIKTKSDIFTKIEYKIILSALSFVNLDNPLTSQYFIDKNDFMKRLSIGKNLSSKELNEILKSLNDYSIIIYKDNRKISYPIFKKIFFNIDEYEIEIVFNDELLRVLDFANRENYVRVSKEYLDKLSSSKSIRMYLYLSTYQNKSVVSFNLDELKELLGIRTKDFSYKVFKRNILKRFINEINVDTDLTIELNEIKRRRKVEQIEFIISR